MNCAPRWPRCNCRSNCSIARTRTPSGPKPCAICTTACDARRTWSRNCSPWRATAFADVPLAPLLRDVVAHHAALAVARGIDLGLDAPQALADLSHVRGDADALQTLFGNLVDNALKYTPHGGHVDVRLVSAAPGAGTVVEVEDNGPGIAPSERERVFDRFFRGGAASAQEAAPPSGAQPSDASDASHPAMGASPPVEGSGLGLAIVRNIAQAHGARVELLDARTGHGLRVRVSFGAAASAVPPAL